MPVYIDPSRPTNGSGTFGDARNTWAGISWVTGETYLQKAGTTYSAGVNVAVNANDVTLGSYDHSSGQQITDKRDYATIAIVGNPCINGNNRTGVTIDNLQLLGDANNIAYPIQALYANSATALNLAVRRCVINSPDGNRAAIRARGSGLVIEDTVVTCDSKTTAAIELTCTNVTLRRLDVTHLSGTAIALYASGGTYADVLNALLEDCVVDTRGESGTDGHGVSIIGGGVAIRRLVGRRCWRGGVLASTQNFEMTDSKILSFDDRRETGDGVQLVGTHDMKRIVISGNEFHGHAEGPIKQCIIVGDLGAGAQSGSIAVSENKCYGMLTSIIVNTPNASVQGNRIYFPVGGGIAIHASGVKAHGNLIVGAGTGAALYLINGLSGVGLYSNAVIGCRSAGIHLNSSSATAKNNVVVQAVSGTPIVIDRSGAGVLNNNAYHSLSGSMTFEWNSVEQASFSAWKSASGQDANSISGDPLLDSNYRPLAGSPCIGAGVYIPGAKHMGGVPLRSPADIGAYAYQPARRVALMRG